jgi:hypothetical protein
VDEIQQLATELNIPIKRGSINENILGREMLRAIVDYYEDRVDCERRERGRPDDPELKQLSLDQLRQRHAQAWQQPTSADTQVGVSPKTQRNGDRRSFRKLFVFL